MAQRVELVVGAFEVAGEAEQLAEEEPPARVGRVFRPPRAAAAIASLSLPARNSSLAFTDRSSSGLIGRSRVRGRRVTPESVLTPTGRGPARSPTSCSWTSDRAGNAAAGG